MNKYEEALKYLSHHCQCEIENGTECVAEKNRCVELLNELIAKTKWHKLSEEPPKVKGYYWCRVVTQFYVSQVLKHWGNDDWSDVDYWYDLPICDEPVEVEDK